SKMEPQRTKRGLRPQRSGWAGGRSLRRRANLPFHILRLQEMAELVSHHPGKRRRKPRVESRSPGTKRYFAQVEALLFAHEALPFILRLEEGGKNLQRIIDPGRRANG